MLNRLQVFFLSTIFSAFAISVSGSTASASPEAESPEKAMKRQQESFKLAKIGVGKSRGFEDRSAILDFDEAIRIAPELGWAWIRRGESYRNLGEFDRANSDFRKAYELTKNSHNPTDMDVAGDAADHLAKRYLQQGKPAEALKVLDAVANNNKRPLDWVRKAKCEMDMHNYEAASKDFEKGLQPKKLDIEALVDYGQCLSKQNKNAEAVALYTRGIDDVMAHDRNFTRRRRYLLFSLRGDCYEKLGKHDLALKDKAQFASHRDDTFELVPFRATDIK